MQVSENLGMHATTRPVLETYARSQLRKPQGPQNAALKGEKAGPKPNAPPARIAITRVERQAARAFVTTSVAGKMALLAQLRGPA